MNYIYPLWASGKALEAKLHAVATTRAIRWLGAPAVFAMIAWAIYRGYESNGALLYQYDDTYITYRYAHNLASGVGLLFNSHDRTDSASSFLYTLLLAAADKLGLHSMPVVGVTIGICGAAGLGAAVYLASIERTRRPLLAFGLGFFSGLHGLISAWSVSGMETTLYACLVTTAVYRIFVRREYGWFESTLVLLCLLTRYEAVLLAGVWFGLGAIRFVRSDARERRRLLGLFGLVAGGFAAFLGFKFALYGTLIPHAFALKTITTLYAPNPRALWSVWQTYGTALLLFAAAGLFTLPHCIESLGFALFIAASVISLLTGPSGDWARYSAHMVPLAAILASVPLSRLLRSVWVLGFAGCLMVAWQAHSSFVDRQAAVGAGVHHARCRQQIGEYLEHNLPAGTVVLSSDIGVMAYFAPSMRFVDAVGLTSKDVLQARMQGENVDKVLFNQKPLVIADTCGGTCARPNEFSAYNWLTNGTYWRTPLPPQRYLSLLQNGRTLDRCRTPDGLSFGAAQFSFAD